jgi:hypothetical protein
MMLEAARVQQQVARARRYWADGACGGNGREGRVCVVDHYPKTAEDLIKSGTPLSGRGLVSGVMSVLKGLRDLQQVAGRPHGNLKPSNVLAQFHGCGRRRWR